MSLPSNKIHTPLIVFVWFKKEPDNFHALTEVQKMIRAAVGPYSNRALIGGNKQLAWGMLVPVNYSPLTTWSVYQNSNELCIFEGEMYDDIGDLKTYPGENPVIGRYIAEHLNKNTEQAFDSMNGIFSGVYFNRKADRAMGFTNHTGTRPVYWLSDDRCFVASTNLWSFRGLGLVDSELDDIAIAQKLTVGFPLLGRTWLKNVRQLQPGQMVIADRNKTAMPVLYKKPIERRPMKFKDAIAFLRESLDGSLQRLSERYNVALGLGLSGGLDSRLILASLYHSNIQSKSFTFFINDSEPDVILSRQLAAMLGLEHYAIRLDTHTAFSLYKDMIIINEGDSTGFGYFLLAARATKHAGNLLIGSEGIRDTPLGPFNPWNFRTKQELADAMLKSHNIFFRIDELHRILNKRKNYKEYILDEWLLSFEFENQSILDVYLDHRLAYRTQRRTRPRLEQTRWFCQPLYPYMDRAVYTAFRSIPVEYLKGERAHIELLKSYKTGIERLSNNARFFLRVPLGFEHRIYPVVQFLRVLNGKVVPHVSGGVQKFYSRLIRKSHVPALARETLESKERCDLLNWQEVSRLIDMAERGVYVNKEALKKIVEVQVIDDMIHRRINGEEFKFISPSGVDIEFIHYSGFKEVPNQIQHD